MSKEGWCKKATSSTTVRWWLHGNTTVNNARIQIIFLRINSPINVTCTSVPLKSVLSYYAIVGNLGTIAEIWREIERVISNILKNISKSITHELRKHDWLEIFLTLACDWRITGLFYLRIVSITPPPRQIFPRTLSNS